MFIGIAGIWRRAVFRSRPGYRGVVILHIYAVHSEGMQFEIRFSRIITGSSHVHLDLKGDAVVGIGCINLHVIFGVNRKFAAIYVLEALKVRLVNNLWRCSWLVLLMCIYWIWFRTKSEILGGLVERIKAPCRFMGKSWKLQDGIKSCAALFWLLRFRFASS